MKVIYEAKVTTVMQHDPDKNGLPSYSSGVEYKTGEYDHKTIYVKQRLELGQIVWVIVTDQDPAVGADDANWGKRHDDRPDDVEAPVA